jgi:translation initiation factor IF-3
MRVDLGFQLLVCIVRLAPSLEIYKQRVLEKEKEKEVKEIKWKEVQIGAKTADHDLQLAIRKIKQFIEQGFHVKVSCRI